MLHDTGLPKASQKYENFSDYHFSLYYSAEKCLAPRSRTHQSRENSPSSATGAFHYFLLFMVCHRILLLVFPAQRFLSGLQIHLFRTRSLRKRKRFPLLGKPKMVEFFEVYHLVFGRTFPAFTTRFFVPGFPNAYKKSSNMPFNPGRNSFSYRDFGFNQNISTKFVP